MKDICNLLEEIMERFNNNRKLRDYIKFKKVVWVDLIICLKKSVF